MSDGLFCDHYAKAGSAKNAELFITRDEPPEALSRAGFSHVQLLLAHGGTALYRAVRSSAKPSACIETGM
jgi:hypothetical protein